MARRRRRHSDMDEALLQGLCHSWPQCSCGDKLRFFDGKPDDFFYSLSADQREDVIVSLALVLTCVMWRAPSSFCRRLALAEFLHPIFDPYRGRPRRWLH
jgi:hypothetical protein